MIKFENLKKSFGEREILKGLTFEVQEGEILFVLGTSGTGKSVLLKTLVGLIQATSGNIWLDQEEISKFEEKDFFRIRKKCGMVFQHPALFDSLTLYENVAFGLKRHFLDWTEAQIKERVSDCLQQVQVNESLDKLPSKLSYGVQKRVSLARTIAIMPRVLLFDEPTTGLDPITTRAINQLILNLSRSMKTTSLVVSHDMHCALEIADRILVLDQGKIVAFGTVDQVKSSEHPLVVDFLSEALTHDRL